MADLIDRQTATRLLYAEFKDFWELPSLAIDRAVQTHVTNLSDIYKKLPAVDAVEVVRCKDCRWLYDYYDGYYCYCHKGLAHVTPESFCSYGERREENAEET